MDPSDLTVSAELKPAASAPNTVLSRSAVQWFMVAFLVYLLICSVSMIGAGFKGASAGKAQALFEYATNPFMGLIIGTVATALIQSSSTVTSIIVGLVAGGLPVGTAVPMIMGANIGTSITNTIVSLGHVRNKQEFRRAFTAATVHDYFNLLAVAIFLPLEIAFGFLQKIATFLSGLLVGGDSVSISSFNFVKASTKPTVGLFKDLTSYFDQPLAGVVLALLGVVFIFFSITLVGKLLRQLMVGKAKEIMHTAIGKGPVSGIFSGTLVTVLVQSSSTTTSLMVPLAGSGVFSLKQIYPFTLGANIGTCVTALLAATAVSGNAQAGLTIAIVHLTFNSLAVLLIYGLPFLRAIPPKCATWLGEVAAENKLYAVAYILGVFFVAPLVCVGISSQF